MSSVRKRTNPLLGPTDSGYAAALLVWGGLKALMGLRYYYWSIHKLMVIYQNWIPVRILSENTPAILEPVAAADRLPREQR